MEKEFVEYIAKALVDQPDEVEVKTIEGEKSVILELKIAQNDVGKVIGKQGRIAHSIRILLGAIATKTGKRNPEEARKICGQDVMVSRQLASQCKIDEYYISDLVNIRVQCHGQDVGVVAAITNDAHPMLCIRWKEANARNLGVITVHIVNIRTFAYDKHKTCDDAPYGGGYGMVLKAEPLASALDSILGNEPKKHSALTICPTPAAPLFTQQDAKRLAQREELLFICGHYEGIDQRIIDLYVDETYSIGEYVVASGEVASMVMLDSVLRLVDGVLNKGSLKEESYEASLLEYPHYTRPASFRGIAVPEILLSGNHKKIAEWRKKKSQELTKKLRPDLYYASSKRGENKL
ncbi:tRNA (guanine-N(1)-)-methyltransferase-like [Ylistrum balloti]|uniref:tRNA (guanine-N(1)-)-methyltransferase-like n=1 Tax=Ylistrum balloti TaxID=509963 RepID=UPI002905A93A|nr:tRNA (guanine-N(1)-)-methyltransferase-like [Ylistrum balloti]